MSGIPAESLVSLASQGMENRTKEDKKLLEVAGSNVTAKIIVASYYDWYDWYHRLQMQPRASQTMRNKSLTYILDSGFNDPDVTNEDVLETAQEIQPDMFIPKDYPGEPEKTAESLDDFLGLYANQKDEIMGEPLLPIQPPYVDNYLDNQDIYGSHNKFALGGLHYYTSVKSQLNAIADFVNTVNPGYIHALGVGTNLEFVMYLRKHPHLIDSLDISTPERAVKNNVLPDKTWIQRDFKVPKGEESTALRALLAKYVIYQLNYMLSPKFDDDDMIDLHQQSTLDSFGESDQDLNLENPTFEPGRDHPTSV